MIAESVRENIRLVIQEAKGNINMSPEIEHMITQISFEMWKHGYKDAMRTIKITSDKLVENLFK